MSDVKVYRVREGVAWVNGARVPADRVVHLTDAEAQFDLQQGRIAPLVADIEATDEPADVAEDTTKRAARRGKRRFKLSESDDGGV